MSIVTLTTDWQNDDFYIGAVKGLLHSKCPGVNVIDISHKIESFKYTQAAFIIRNAISFYPEGTIHIIGINSDTNNNQPAVCIMKNGQYFIGASNGIFGLIFSEKPDFIIKINETETIKSSSFPELSVFAEAACFLLNGGNVKELGPEFPDQYRHVQFMPAFDDDDITGSVLYIDSYKNIITNINVELFEQVRKGRAYTITVKSEAYKIERLSKNYSEVEVGDMLGLFNSLGLLEIAMRNARIAELLDIKVNSPVTIKFK